MHLFRLWLAAMVIGFATAQPARAVTLIRDADIEHALEQLAAPILRAAGLSPGNVRILIIDDRSLNAFVIDGRAIFIHSGLLLKLESAGQLQSVIAHEAAHISNGHITRRLTNMRASRNTAAFGMALAAAVAMSTGRGDAAAGVAAGIAGSSQRNLFAHTRAEESAADQSGTRYMLRAGADPNAALEVLEIFRGQEALSIGRQDPYARTHPLTSDRLRALRGLIAANPATPADQSSANYWFARAQGKLSAFTQNPSWTLRRTGNDTSAVAQMRRAVAYHRQADAGRAISIMQALLAANPNDAFLHELFGQILLESRQAAAAVNAYGRAVNLAPNEPLILGGYGRALLAMDTADSTRRAVAALQRARDRDPLDGRILRDLGQAYARAGQNGLASLATAERYALAGRMDDAALHATRAADQLARGSAPWQRAQDVISAAQTR
ncbi:M48 family metalloprotease [Octadecabacter sp. R77987]|uniref:M48 family metalloprotease n=1 Tax=Octadecabacter sp. R77987 TaxID=3093874 RepID=UPI00366C68E8